MRFGSANQPKATTPPTSTATHSSTASTADPLSAVTSPPFANKQRVAVAAAPPNNTTGRALLIAIGHWRPAKATAAAAARTPKATAVVGICRMANQIFCGELSAANRSVVTQQPAIAIRAQARGVKK